MRIQSILFLKSAWSLPEVVRWLRDHGKATRKIDISPTYYRARQIPPSQFRRMRIVKPKGSTIHLIVGA